MSTIVVKLGSSIVADGRGEVRLDILGSVCDQTAELYAGGDSVVLVTSGAIARGMRLMEMPMRPSAINTTRSAYEAATGSCVTMTTV